jgi:hypothetical protein
MRQRLALAASIGVVVAGVALGSALARSPAPKPRPELGPTRLAATAPALSAGQQPEPPAVPSNLALKQIYTVNQSAFIPPQCYTKTIDDAGKAHNPCYTCHVGSRAPNYINDADVQLTYAFVPRARSNAWKNLLVDWREKIRDVSDERILSYIRTSNYFDARNEIILARKLAQLPSEWDHGDDRRWSGFVPDARFAFDGEGFDRLPEGGYTGWRAFAYYPVPGTFWPTNGSIGDVLIRLPDVFRQDESSRLDLQAYKLNLAVVEATVTRRSIAVDPVDERAWGLDLDQNGRLGTASEVRFVGEPAENPPMSFVGRARLEQSAGRLPLAVGLYPQGTEFLHTVRYLDPTDTGIRLAARLKELRYAKKIEWWSYQRLHKRARVEAIGKEDSPTELRNFGGDIERGVNNGQGWTFQGFIEDARGDLRPQTFEETVYCTGCHGGLGVTDDAIFSFSRRLQRGAFQQGYYHWSQRGLEGVRDRPVAGGSEYVSYLEHNGAGDEFRQNSELIARFFDERGRLKAHMRARLQRDVSEVLMPSRERALALDKAYWLLVAQQNFRQGREIVLDGARNLHSSLSAEQPTGITTPLEPPWSASTAVAVRSR